MAEYAPLTKLTGVWQKTSGKGVTYFTGRLGAAKLVILLNRDKQTDTDPDLIVYVQERTEAPKPQQTQDGKAEPGSPLWGGDIPDSGAPRRRRQEF